MIEHRTWNQAETREHPELRPALAQASDHPAAIAELAGALARMVRVATGRLGCVLTPWLDEGMLVGQGMVALAAAVRGTAHLARREDELIRAAVESLRRWARLSSWYHEAWPRHVAPLCVALAARPGASPRALAAELGLTPAGLGERFTEAGLVFGVSPELILPAAVRPDGRLAQAVSELPLEQRSLLVLYFQDELSFPEIAQSLELTPARTQELYGRAAAAVRAALAAGE